MSGTVTATSIVVMWSGAGSPVNGYYISWRRTDLGDSATAEYAQVTGVMHMLTNLFAGVTYDITVWSTDGTGVSSPVSRQVTTSESGELSLYVDLVQQIHILEPHTQSQALVLLVNTASNPFS